MPEMIDPDSGALNPLSHARFAAGFGWNSNAPGAADRVGKRVG
jgi:hypothetical protein